MPIDELLVLNPKMASVNVWMGQPGVIAHCHYDGYHNFYTQLFGRKRFTLFRPLQWRHLYPYPYLHPSHAQCQVNLSDPNMEQFPAVENAESVEVILEPGDLLYLPPLWFHHVESVDVSISVNVWTDSVQSLVMQRVYETVNPALAHFEGKLKALLLLRTITKTLQEAAAQNLITSHQNFVQSLYQGRYHRLILDKVLPSLPDVSWPWKSSEDLCTLYTQLKSSVSEIESRKDVDVYVKTVVEHLADLPDDTRELWLGNYIESSAALAVSPELVGQLLHDFSNCQQMAL
eukprot:m.188926 g.188926  ORF g.188926 m.188926 type:complete len:289 (+) comp39398_c0_seq3:781-1647(+)